MNIYVVTEGSYSDYHIRAVFSTEEKAWAYIDALPENRRDEYEVECYGVDETMGWEYGPVWHAAIKWKDGEAWSYKPRDRIRPPSACVVEETDAAVHVYSPISQEHAEKVAAEKRQEWLRTHDVLKATDQAGG
jgi:hypothetical protein